MSIKRWIMEHIDMVLDAPGDTVDEIADYIIKENPKWRSARRFVKKAVTDVLSQMDAIIVDDDDDNPNMKKTIHVFPFKEKIR